jgi:hypothetical protein
MKLSLLGAAAVFCLSLPGCEIGLLIAATTDEPADEDYAYGYEDYGGESVGIQVSETRMVGTIGPAESFSSEPFGDAQVGSGWASIVLTSDDLDVPAMAGFSIGGDDAEALFVPGSRIELEEYSSSFGCAGDGFEYETFGEGGELVVEESDRPGVVTVSFRVDLESGDEVEGSFDLAVPPT